MFLLLLLSAQREKGPYVLFTLLELTRPVLACSRSVQDSPFADNRLRASTINQPLVERRSKRVTHLVVLGLQRCHSTLHLHEARLHLVAYQHLSVHRRHFIAFVRFESNALGNRERRPVVFEVLLLVGHGVEIANRSVQRVDRSRRVKKRQKCLRAARPQRTPVDRA